MDKSLKNILQIAIVAVVLIALIATTVLFAGEDGFAKETINSLMGNSTKGADDIVSNYINDMEIPLEPGLYNDNNNLICSWDSLVNDYGLVLDANERTGFYSYAEGGKNILTYILADINYATGEIVRRPEFVNAWVLVLPNTVTEIKKGVFTLCELSCIVIPDSVTNIESGALATSSNCIKWNHTEYTYADRAQFTADLQAAGIYDSSATKLAWE